MPNILSKTSNLLLTGIEQSVLLALSFIIPKDRSLWVYGCIRGYAEGCAAIIEMAQQDRANRNIWLYRCEKERKALQSLEIENYKLKSIRGYWYCLRANLAFISYGFNDLNGSAIFNAKIINVWHGTPLKKIYFDSPQLSSATTLDKLKNLFKSRFTNKIYLFPVSSDLSKIRIETAFRLRPNKAVITGEPRTDKLIAKFREPEKADELIEKIRSIGQGRSIIYAPTWRDNPITTCMTGYSELLSTLEETDSYLIFRPHPRDINNPILEQPHDRVLYLPQKTYQDINDYLPLFGKLITDYSSIAIDFSLCRRSIYFLANDLNEYDQTQGLYETYAEFTGSVWHENWSVLARALKSDLLNEVVENKTSKRILDRYHFYTDGNSTLRTYTLCKTLSAE